MAEDSLTTLERWRDSGGDYRVVELSDERAIVDLCTCHGEAMDRLDSDDSRLIAHLRAVADRERP
jgi:hypothetical protein